MPYRPPYTVTPEMTALTNEINRLVGRLEGYQLLTGNVRLRRKNKIRSLHSSLAIEGNRLSPEQVTALLDGKRIIGPAKDILEVTNAIAVYDELPDINPYTEDVLLAVHGRLMHQLIPDAGRYRTSGVGVLDGERVVHLAPPARQVPRLMCDLFDYLKNVDEDLLIKSCVFHFEFEFIHPFSDGNGRMGRLWQTAILQTKYPDLAFVPIESMVYTRQQAYYNALQQSQHDAHSNAFILYSLTTVRDAVREQLATETAPKLDWRARLTAFSDQYSESTPFSRKDYQLYYKQIAPATATRDLREGVRQGLLIKEGTLRTVVYSFVPK